MCLQTEIPRDRRMGVTIFPHVFSNYEKAQEHLAFRAKIGLTDEAAAAMTPREVLTLDWVEKADCAGEPLAQYACPSCPATIYSLIPAAGRSYSSLVACPRCRRQHFRVIEADGTVAILRQGAAGGAA
jgi:hypothetical protein